ncbi:MAG: sigma-70 family RNA polymerase sigma factor [Chloroflexi bacterium]|nr:MAG: sigma-70 family RNA polymerase sigma factor [Chloroflexota bacterium]
MQKYMTQDFSHPVVPIDEEACQIAAARKDPRAFGLLYDRYAPKIYRYLLSRLRSVEEAKDVTSQTFLTAIESFPRYKHNGYFSAWLFSIARSKYVDHLRKSKHRSEIFEEQEQASLPDPLLQVIETERMAELRRIIRGLPEDEQEMLRLRYVAELGFAEMASVMNKKQDAVKKSLYRLLARLYAVLQNGSQLEK